MKCLHWLVGSLAAAALLLGCRAASRVIEEPRADFDMPTGGNRGYLVGTPAALSDIRKPTRQMVEAEFETPPVGRATGAPPTELGEGAPAEEALSESAANEEAADAAATAGPTTTYTVRKGDTLWSIAAKPEVFGDGTKWRRLYRMNRDVLPSADRLRPGLTLKIPQAGQGGAAATASSEPATTFTK